MDAAISLKNVTKRYEGFTLDHITMDIPKGSIVGLVGENGAGKTTLIKAILQMVRIQEGEILIDGSRVEDLAPQWKDKVGVILSGVEFAAQMSARRFGRCMRSLYKDWREDQFERYLKDLQIDGDKMIKDYSKGMKMKLDLAVSLSHQAEILIFDEATSGGAGRHPGYPPGLYPGRGTYGAALIPYHQRPGESRRLHRLSP